MTPSPKRLVAGSAAVSVAIWLALTSLPRAVSADPLRQIEQSPAGVAMSGAMTARSDDASAVYYNPAAMAMQRGLGLVLGANALRVDLAMTPVGGARETSSTSLGSPALFVSQRLGAHFAVGLGVFSEWSGDYRWPDSGAGRLLARRGEFRSYTLNPTVAIRPVPRVAIGFGLVVMPTTFFAERALDYGAREGALALAATGTALGANAGLLVQIIRRRLDLGVSYRSVLDVDLDGNASLGQPPELARSTSSFQVFYGTLTMPHTVAVGLLARPGERWSLSADLHVAVWSDLSRFEGRLEDLAKSFDAGVTQLRTELRYRTSLSGRLGGEVELWREHLRLRLGVGYQSSHVPSATLSPANVDGPRVLASGGLAFRWGAFALEAAYQANVLVERTSSHPVLAARYSGLGHLVGVAVVVGASGVGGRIDDPDYKR